MSSGMEPNGNAITGVPVANASTTEAERLGEADEVQEGQGPAEQSITFDRADRSGVRNACPPEVWLDAVTEVGTVLHDPSDHEWKAGPACGLDRQMPPLVRVDAT